MSIYEVTNLDTGRVEIVSAADCSDLSSYFHRIKIAALDPSEHVQVVYYINGRWHNEHGPAIVYRSGSKEWCINGKLHNENDPAIIYNDGHKEWYINNKLHNKNGPAVVYSNGTKQWWINGKVMTEEEFNEYIRSHKS